MRRVGQPAQNLQIGDDRIHLGEQRWVAVEGTDLRRLAVALGDSGGGIAVR